MNTFRYMTVANAESTAAVSATLAGLPVGNSAYLPVRRQYGTLVS